MMQIDRDRGRGAAEGGGSGWMERCAASCWILMLLTPSYLPLSPLLPSSSLILCAAGTVVCLPRGIGGQSPPPPFVRASSSLCSCAHRAMLPLRAVDFSCAVCRRLGDPNACEVTPYVAKLWRMGCYGSKTALMPRRRHENHGVKLLFLPSCGSCN